jgi:hypothetical protein
MPTATYRLEPDLTPEEFPCDGYQPGDKTEDELKK